MDVDGPLEADEYAAMPGDRRGGMSAATPAMAVCMLSTGLYAVWRVMERGADHRPDRTVSRCQTVFQ